MPLKLNCGLSRKVGEANYGSRGASVNLELELESALASDPPKLKERIRQAFDTIRTSLADELNGNGNGHNNTNGNGNQPGNGYPSNGNGAGQNQDQPSRSVRPATASQVKAIFAIAKSQHVDVKLLVQNRFRVSRLAEYVAEVEA